MGNQQRNLYFFKETFNDYPVMGVHCKLLAMEAGNIDDIV